MKSFKSDLDLLKNLFSPYTKRVYLVGGCVRDMFLKKEPKEFDLEVYDIDLNVFDKLMTKIGAKGVGKSFFVYKWKNFDIALPRKETKIAKGHKGFEVEIVNDEKIASKRRDFRMNALMQNIYTGEILDFWGGIEDIKKRVIRHIDDNTFREDSLRVLRAMQFASRLKFKVAKETIKICQEIDLSDLSKERIYMEFEKMFGSKYLYYGFYYFIVLGVAKKLFGLDFNKKEFFKLARLYKNNPLESFFLYHLVYFKNLNQESVAKKLNLPNRLKRDLKIKKCPKKVTNKFLYALALKYPLKTFSILNLSCCKDWIIENNLWEKKYKPQKIDPKNPRASILKEIREKNLEVLEICKVFNNS